MATESYLFFASIETDLMEILYQTEVLLEDIQANESFELLVKQTY